MKKGLLLLLAVASAFAVATKSLAGDARLNGMAADARITEDQNLVFTYPNKAVEYNNYVDIRLGSLSTANASGVSPFITTGVTGDEWGGFSMKEDDLGVIGVYANRPGAVAANGFFNFITSLGGPNLNPVPLELFWAKDFDGMSLGAKVLYADHRDHLRDDNYQDWGANVGLGFTSEAFSQINVHASFETASVKLGGFDGTGAPINLGAGALLQSDIDKDHYLRFFGDFLYASNPLFTNLVATASNAINWDLGIGCTKKVNGGKALISGGLIVTQTSLNAGDPSVVFSDSTRVNWSTSVEATVNSWLVVRTGISKALYDSANKVTDDPFVFATGASIMWQNFTLDLNISPASIQQLFGSPEVGGGIFYPSSNNQGLFEVASADLSYKF